MVASHHVQDAWSQEHHWEENKLDRVSGREFCQYIKTVEPANVLLGIYPKKIPDM